MCPLINLSAKQYSLWGDSSPLTAAETGGSLWLTVKSIPHQLPLEIVGIACNGEC